MVTKKYFWQSKTMIGAGVSILALLSFLLGFDLGDEEATVLVQLIVGGIGAVLTIYGRIKANGNIK